MNIKTLIWLALALALLVAAARYLNQAPAAKAVTSGKPLNVDLAAVEKFTVACGTQSVTVARSADSWTIENLWGYPASYDRISENIRKLGELKGESIRGGRNSLAEFGLVPSNVDYVAVSFFDAAGKSLGQVELGSPHLSKSVDAGGYPDGQYIRPEDGEVFLVGQYLGGFPRRPEDWIERQILNIEQAGLAEIKVKNHAGDEYSLTSSTSGVWSVADLKTKEEQRSDVAASVAGALGYVTVQSIGKPGTSIANPSTLTAKTTNGLVYAIVTGELMPDIAARYATISVSYVGADTNAAALAQSENAKLSPWVYALPESVCGNLTKHRVDLVQAKTDAPPASAPTTASPAPPTPAN